ncbi:MAG: hypothetical protein VXZ53_08675 [Planctomycetota bacterium]|nr:hypothetical protein [Planctomycetota bacterium]
MASKFGDPENYEGPSHNDIRRLFLFVLFYQSPTSRAIFAMATGTVK